MDGFTGCRWRYELWLLAPALPRAEEPGCCFESRLEPPKVGIGLITSALAIIPCWVQLRGGRDQSNPYLRRSIPTPTLVQTYRILYHPIYNRYLSMRHAPLPDQARRYRPGPDSTLAGGGGNRRQSS